MTLERIGQRRYLTTELTEARISGDTRLGSIQALRAVAASAVVLAHLTVSYTNIMSLAPGTIPDFFVGNAGVDIFFVISGFIMVYASEPLFGQPGASREFLLRRLIRIVPLYWLATSYELWGIVHYAGAQVAWPMWINIVGSYLFLPLPRLDGSLVPLLTVGWTLNYEMFFYVVFAVAIVARRGVAVMISTLFLVAVVTIGQQAGAVLPKLLEYWTNPLLLEFVLGTWIALILRAGIRIPGLAALPLFIIGACLIVLQPPNHGQIFRVATWGAGAAALVASCALCRWTARGRTWRAVTFLGDASYSLYLCHWFILMTPPKPLVRLIPPLEHPYSYAIAATALTFAISIAVHLCIERPITKLLNRCLLSPRRPKAIEHESSGSGPFAGSKLNAPYSVQPEIKQES